MFQKFRRRCNVMVWLLPSFMMLFFCTGCVPRVKLVGEYDEILDRSVTEIQEQTATFFLKMRTASTEDALYEVNTWFYHDVQGKIAALIRRSEVIEEGLQKKPLTRNFKELRLQYLELAEQHKKGFSKQYIESAETAFDQSFRAILKNILYLKWSKPPPS
jgi:hypothetical protein